MSTVIDLSALATGGFIIQGDATGDQAGFSVSSAGDVNGDGLADLIVGARLGDDGGTNAGEAYVIFGKAGGLANIDLTGLAPADGFIIQGDAIADYAGYSVASAGDINGDGFDDLIVGARGGDNGGSNAGEAYVIFGKSGGFATIDLAALALADGFIIQGDAAEDRAGSSVASAGDVNGDGFDDIIVGVPQGDNGGIDAGEAYVIFGKAAGFANLDLSTLGAAAGFIIQGDYAGDQAGRSVSSAGDVNGDGFDDIIVGALYGDNGGTSAGEAYVVFGKAAGFANIDLSTLGAADGFIIQGAGSADNAGRSVSSAGDINRDGFDDILVGAPLAETGFRVLRRGLCHFRQGKLHQHQSGHPRAGRRLRPARPRCPGQCRVQRLGGGRRQRRRLRRRHRRRALCRRRRHLLRPGLCGLRQGERVRNDHPRSD